jgi:subtilisin-like proprotein convertase family protein
MRRSATFIFVLLCSFSSIAQVFTGSAGPIQNTGNDTYFSVNVSGLSALDSLYGIEEVSFDITHPSVEELNISLRSPSGMKVELTIGANCHGANYTGTVLRSDLSTAISVGTAPYTGSFRPTGYLGRFNNKQQGNGNWTLVVQDWNNQGGSGTVNSWSIKFGNKPSPPVLFNSSNLPIVIINSNNQNINDLTDVNVNLNIIANVGARNNVTDFPSNFHGKANIHIRGSSSKIFEKKSYKINLTDASGVNEAAASVLWMPAETDWVLTAAYPDKSLMRNALIHNMFRGMGHYSPRTQFVELILNGEYMGVYSFMEDPKHNLQRVNIQGMSSLDNNFPNITGGYIIQINRNDKPGWYSLYPGNSINNPPAKFYYQYSYPNELNITPQQKNYIKSVMDTFETVMNSPNFADPVTGYRKYIDVPSFVDFFILNEFSKNVDGYKLSTYLYKDDYIAGGKLHAGPMWDYDLGFHNCNGGLTFSEMYWQYDQPSVLEPIPTWWTKLMQDDYFKNMVYCRWHTLRLNTLNNSQLFAYIDQNAALLDEAQKRNFKQFPILGAYVYPNPQPQAGATFAGEVNDIKTWLSKRGAWLDANMPGYCNNVGIAEIDNSEAQLLAYPNPFSNELDITYTNSENGLVKIELLDLMGKKVLSICNGQRNMGFNHERISTSELSPGTYILCMNVDNKKWFKKIIKLDTH